MARTESFLSKNNEWSFLDENENVLAFDAYTEDWESVDANGNVLTVGGLVLDYKHIYSHYAYRVVPPNGNTAPITVRLQNQSVPANIKESTVLANRSTSERIKYITSDPLSGYTYSDGVITSSSNEFLTIGTDILTHGDTIVVTGTERDDATYTAVGHDFNIGDLVTVTGVAPESYAIYDKEIIAVTTDTFTVTEMQSDIGPATPFVKVTGEQPAYAIGDTGPAGGKIFITPQTHGNNTGLYFEAAPAATQVSRRWSALANASIDVVGANGTAIGTGATNTLDIVAQSGNIAADSAAAYCNDLSYGGYVDWFLPSKDELNQMYVNKTTIGGFVEAEYWSSSEYDASNAWYQLFINGNQFSTTKYPQNVRPIRSFSAPSTPLNYSYVNSASMSENSTSLIYTSAGHEFGVGSVVTVIGATVDIYNVTNAVVISVTEDTFTVEPYSIGDTGPGGGLIFMTPSTPGNASGKYLEAAPIPVGGEVSRTWATSGNQSIAVTGANGTAIGTGAQNTIDIVAQAGNVAATSAAVYCSELVSGGQSDWFLPSLYELQEIYENLYLVSTGDFNPTSYWSSSENSGVASEAQFYIFSSGLNGTSAKSNDFSVRPIRSFLLTNPGVLTAVIKATVDSSTYTVTNIIQNNVSYITAGHRFSVGQLISVSNTLPAEYNVIKVPIIRVSETTFTVEGISTEISPMSQSGIARASGDEGRRVLVKSETGSNAKYNGIYTVIDVGGPNDNWVLQRKESFPLAFNCMTRSNTRSITSTVQLYESGGSTPGSVPTYQGVVGRYGAVRSNIFNSFTSLSPYNVDIEITISNHEGEAFYITLPFLYNYYGWLANTYVQNARRQYLPHFYWDVDSQQDPDYPFYKLLDVMTYKADEVMQSYSDFFTYELSELPVGTNVTEPWANSTLTSPSDVSLANREWLSQFTGGKLLTALPSGVAAGTVNVDAFIEWQLVNKYYGYRSGSTQSVMEAVKLCLTGDKTVAIAPSFGNDVWKVKIYTKISETPADYEIGDIGPGGGKVFITPSTAGNSTGKYFEVAPVVEEVQRTWATGANQSAVVSGADGTAIGTGAQNTVDIVAQSGNVAATSAAKYCSDLVSGGKSDWFLPSKDELNQIYANSRVTAGNFIIGVTYTINTVGTTNFTLIGASANTIGVTFTATGVGSGTGVADILNTGFSTVNYWSSSEYDAFFVWGQSFSNGLQDGSLKDSTTYVRPVRSFNTSKTVLALAELVRPMGYIYEHDAINSIDFILDNYGAGILGTASLGDRP